MPTQATGPAAFLALFAKGECQALNHEHCGKRMCPCDDARLWLMSLPRRMPFAKIWAACIRNDWLQWLTHNYDIDGGSTVDETRALVPWERMMAALANPPKEGKCEHCEEMFPINELSHKYCQECESDHYVFCAVCDAMHSRDDNNPCGHLRWSDDAGSFVGTGAGDEWQLEEHGIAESFDALLVKLGLVLARKLLVELERGKFGRSFDECQSRLDELMDERRAFDHAPFEAGLLWLDTLHPGQTQYVAMTTTWTREHIARRERAIKLDKSPRHIIVDGDKRVYVDGQWSAIRAHAQRLTARKAHRLRKRIEAAFAGVKLTVVHVLKRAPKWKKVTR